MKFVDGHGREVEREGRTRVKDLDLDVLRLTIRNAIICKLIRRGYSYGNVAKVLGIPKTTAYVEYRALSEKDRRALEVMDICM